MRTSRVAPWAAIPVAGLLALAGAAGSSSATTPSVGTVDDLATPTTATVPPVGTVDDLTTLTTTTVPPVGTVDDLTTLTTTTEPGGETTEPGESTVPESTAPDGETSVPGLAPAGEGIRIATFNASLNRAAEGELVENLSTPDDPQAAAVAEIIQRTQPDILLINEFDYVENDEAVDLFRDNYLAVSQNGAEPVEYPYAFTAPVNTGVESGLDLNNDGTVGGSDDAFGFGEFPGQFGMVVLSRYPIVEDEVRTFQNLLWASMPDARLPDDPATPEPADWYSPEELEVFRLSSKSHWAVPVDVDGEILHVLASHPTPPVFDGEEDRNGTRNADEIRFWADYIAGEETSWIVDDTGETGGLAADGEFVIVGDLNSDPFDGDSIEGATQQVLDLDRVQDPAPTSEGAVEAAETQGLANETHESDPATDTADFNDEAPGNLRADYVLPSDGLEIVDAGVFWPPTSDPLSSLVVIDPWTSSDHRLVWVDLDLG
jgi:endonuclease/exonuclease/phosphatase family metal-dependent hydrolase